MPDVSYDTGYPYFLRGQVTARDPADRLRDFSRHRSLRKRPQEMEPAEASTVILQKRDREYNRKQTVYLAQRSREPAGRDKTGARCYSDDGVHGDAFTGYREKKTEAVQWGSVRGAEQFNGDV